MEFKGTKGEWKHQYNGYYYQIILPSDKERKNVNNVSVFKNVMVEDNNYENAIETDEEFEANAKLIAASPDLLEALTQILKAPQPFNEKEFISWVQTARIISKQAIEKALK